MAKKLSARLSKASGAVNDDADMRIPGFLIESKRRENIGNKIIFNVKFWEKLRKQSVRTNRVPVYAWHTNNQCFCITYKDNMCELLQKLKKPIQSSIVSFMKSINIIVKIEDYYLLHDTAYNSGKTPSAEFPYNHILMSIVDFDTFKKCTEAS